MIYAHEYKTFSYQPLSSVDTDYIDLQFFVKLLNLDGLVYQQYTERVTLDYIDNFIHRERPRIYFFNRELLKQYHPSDTFRLAKKYPKTLFVFFDHETHNFESTRKYSKQNFVLICNSYENLESAIHQNTFNYYLLNGGLQVSHNEFMLNLFRSTQELKRPSKYNFFNGVHKYHRIIGYELFKKYNLLDEGYFSYMDYTNYLEDETTIGQIKYFLNLSDDEYEKYINQFQIPYLHDSNEPNPNIYKAFLIPPQTSLSSYFYVSTETYFFQNQLISTSEKSFKGFLGFNIPLIFGQRKLYSYLRNCGFDMFDDFFDNEECETVDDMIIQFDSNVKKIKDISKSDLHNYYLNTSSRLRHNFDHVVNKTESDIELIRLKCQRF